MADLGEVQQVLHAFACAYDDRDVTALEQLLSRDATLFGCDGRDSVLAEVARRFARSTGVHRHLVINAHVVAEGDAEVVVRSTIVLVAVQAAGPVVQVTGDRLETLVREGGSWRLRDRRTDLDVVPPPQ